MSVLLLTKYKICAGLPRNIMAGYEEATLLSSWHYIVLCLKQSENVHLGELVIWQFPPFGASLWSEVAPGDRWGTWGASL